MKLQHLKKDTVRRLKRGCSQTFLDLVEEAYDLLNEDKFDSGYRSCMDDMAVRSYRLAEHLRKKELDQINGRFKDVDDLAKVIEDYFTEALNKEE